MYTNYNNILHKACQECSIDNIILAINLGATEFNKALNISCEHEHIDAINLLIDIGATNCNQNLISACNNGRIDLVKSLLFRHNTTLNLFKINTCIEKYPAITDLIIEKGITIPYHMLHKISTSNLFNILLNSNNTIYHETTCLNDSGSLHDLYMVFGMYDENNYHILSFNETAKKYLSEHNVDAGKADLLRDYLKNKLWIPTLSRYNLCPFKFKKLIHTLIMIRKYTMIKKYVALPVLWIIINMTY